MSNARQALEADVVVIGSGAAGLTSALVAARAGLSVIVLESTRWFGGTTARSIGGIWIPANHHMLAAGKPDSRDEANTYLRTILGHHYDREKIAAYLDNAPAMLRYLEEASDVRFEVAPTPDYSAGEPGWKAGRTLVPLKFDARNLGDLADLVRPHIPEMGLFSSMQVPFAEYRRFIGWTASFANFRLTATSMLAYGRDRLLGRRGRQLANGNALIGRLLKSARDAGVTLLNEARAQRLLVSNGRVSGVVFFSRGGVLKAHARHAVVLASGGFGANEAMRRRYLAQADAGWSLQPEGAQGDGIRLGIEAGGVMIADNPHNAIWTAVSTYHRRDGSRAVYPSMVASPGTLKVDAATGQRFVDETRDYVHFGSVTRAANISRAWVIADALAVRRYGLGMAKPAPFSVRPWVRRGYIVEAPSIADLAGRIGLDPSTLEETVERFNCHADRGEDPDFGRGEKIFSRYWGDPTVKPHPNLRALTHPPFYALEIRPGEFSTVAGLDVNARGQVLNAGKQPVPGLYAVGIDANSVFHGHYPGAGSAIGPAMTFAYVAARDIAATSKPEQP